MNSDEIKNNLAQADNQFNIRVARLKRLYQSKLFSDEIIDQEIKLIKDAGERLRIYSLPYEEMIAHLPEIEGGRILKEALQNIEFEELLAQEEKKWENIENELNIQHPGNNIIIHSLINSIKERTMLY